MTQGRTLLDVHAGVLLYVLVFIFLFAFMAFPLLQFFKFVFIFIFSRSGLGALRTICVIPDVQFRCVDTALSSFENHSTHWALIGPDVSSDRVTASVHLPLMRVDTRWRANERTLLVILIFVVATNSSSSGATWLGACSFFRVPSIFRA